MHLLLLKYPPNMADPLVPSSCNKSSPSQVEQPSSRCLPYCPQLEYKL